MNLRGATMKTAPNFAGSDTGEASEHNRVEPAKTASYGSQQAARECGVEAGTTRKVGVRHR